MSLSIINRDPLFREVRDVMQDYFRTPLIEEPLGSVYQTSSRLNMKSDLIERDDCYTLAVELPGIRKEDIEVSIENDNVTVTATKNECCEDIVTKKGSSSSQVPANNNWYHFRERQYGRFQRTFKLPSNADPNKAVAKNENGTLLLQFPKIVGSAAHRKLVIA
eukprot:gene18973-24784_t